MGLPGEPTGGQPDDWSPDPHFPQDPEFYRRVLDHVPTPLLVVNSSGEIIYGNRSMAELEGRSTEESVGSSILGYIHPDDMEWVVEAFVQLVDEPRPRLTHDVQPWASVHVRMIGRDGTEIPLEVTATGAVSDPVIGGVIYDVRPARNQAVLTSVLTGLASGDSDRELLGHVVDLIANPPLDLDAVILEQGEVGAFGVLAASRDDLGDAFQGHTEAAPWDQPARSPTFVDVADLPAPIAERLTALGFVDLWHIAVESEIGSQSYRIITCSPSHHTPATGVINRVIRAGELASIVLLRAQTDAALEHAAAHDHLTQLLNRTGFRQRAAEMQAAHVGDPIAALFVDLDDFKPINDEFGHATGDRVLQITAERLRGACRDGDIVARLGGDEFFVMLGRRMDEPVDAISAKAVADRIVEAIGQPIHVDDVTTQVTASVGLVVADAGLDVDELLARADRAMFSAKRAGGDRRHIGPHH
ncbi:MAG: diguanylate cyclase [Ilumatobacter sp.]|uniref:sensor domain-containing protein n=1 Tax=Ilumatobacter sp. TaxID=1967498 RepID=UPI002616DBF8|nr:diguanylate cyclase [Ilumatobacter sp.]MDJ0767187.1 diguanylate cyclase [Ilumatobacter sp.]